MIAIIKEFKQQIRLYIDLLNKALPENKNSLEYHELNHWIPNCIKCLQFALDNEELLKEKPSLFNDMVDTIYLLHAWIFEDDSYAYIILKKKFGRVYTPEEVGNAFKKLAERLKETRDEVVDYQNEYQGKNLKDILEDLSKQWNVIVDNNALSINSIKKQIKYSHNPLEIKMLNKKLNELYKTKERRGQ